MSNNSVAIISLYEAGMRQCDIVRQLAIPRLTVSRAIKRYQELGTVKTALVVAVR